MPFCDKVTHDRAFSAEKLFSLSFPANHRPDHPCTMHGDRRNSIIRYAGCLNIILFNNQDAGNEDGGAWAHPLHLDRNLDEGTITPAQMQTAHASPLTRVFPGRDSVEEYRLGGPPGVWPVQARRGRRSGAL